MYDQQQQTRDYDVVIVGGGVTGAALLYILANYTNIKRIALFEKSGQIGSVNSRSTNNSQTLHFGDIETNYTLEKASRVKRGADLVAGYIENIDPDPALYTKTHKMVLGVGETEVKKLEERFDTFAELFPKLRKAYRDELIKLEPHIVRERPLHVPLLGLVSTDGFAVNYGKLAESFVARARNAEGKHIDVYLQRCIESFREHPEYTEIKTGDGTMITARALEIAAGANSLRLAHRSGYGRELILLPVFGSFYFSRIRGLLNGKVYTLQLKKLPFAAIHGDPEVNDGTLTRFGPTAKVLPWLERGNPKSFIDFMKLFRLRLDAILSLLNIISDPILFRYVIRNFLYDIPGLGRRLFVKQVQHIIPSMTHKDIRFAKGYGGVRPQIVNTNTKNLQMGSAKITGKRVVFNITPSPGASICLQSGIEDAEQLIKILGEEFTFDKQRLCDDLRRR